MTRPIPDATGPSQHAQIQSDDRTPPEKDLPDGLDVAVGIDVVSIERVAGVLERRGDSFLDRVFTDAEVEYCRERADPAQHFAARWAAKEATVKALPDRSAPVRLADVAVTRDDDRGAPGLAVTGGAATAARAFGGTDETPGRTVSLSHDRDAGVAAAVVVLTGADGETAAGIREAVAAAHAESGLAESGRDSSIGKTASLSRSLSRTGQ